MHQTMLAPGYEGFFQRDAKPTPQPKKPKKETAMPQRIEVAAPVTTSKKVASQKRNDPDRITITDDPYVVPIPGVRSKYEQQFKALKPKQAMRMPSEMISTVADALRKFIRRNQMVSHVRHCNVYTDPRTGKVDEGFGRVWLWPGPQTSPSARMGDQNGSSAARKAKAS